MKILAVSQSFYPYTGGVSYYLLWLGRNLREKGHELRVVHLRPPKAPVRGSISGIEVTRVPPFDMSPKVLAGYTKFKELILKVFHGVERSGDKVFNRHLYGFNEYLEVNSYFIDAITKAYEGWGFDILHIHDFQLLPLIEMIKGLDTPKVFTWHIPFTERVPIAWRRFVVSYMNLYDRVIFSTKGYIATALRSGLSWEKARCVPPFIDIERPERNEFRSRHGISKDERLILCVARIDRLKGQDVLLKAMRYVVDEIDGVKCVFVGDGSMTRDVLKAEEKRRYDRRLKELVEELDLDDHVIFTGHISRDELMQAYESCDLVVLPSIMEGFGLAMTEGMAFGKPIIGSATGGIMIQIWPGINGFLMEPGNHRQLAEAIKRVLSDRGLAERLGRSGLEIYEREYSVERGARDHLSIYGELLGKSL